MRFVQWRGRCDVNSPEACACGFTLAMEDRGAVLIMDREGMFSEEGGAVGIAQLPLTEEVVSEGRW